ncbi:hypothetical protein L1987_43107 [Smallanthus sonchifolius]|uniref:Uncharacterized protein n=1 Tax=Smallanthus sonchifolius TaxID=185202 RepID=A0ACB9GLY7_9ASTR|nr:hypothetical protein L1987_43107 [Smallanthus sonchifolius]
MGLDVFTDRYGYLDHTVPPHDAIVPIALRSSIQLLVDCSESNQLQKRKMAMHSSRLTQDQNLSVHFDGFKTNGSIVQKNKGVLGGRKALNDISNSGKPSALQPSRKHNTKNVIPIGEDLGVPRKAQIPVSGRKALGDLTNSAIPSSQKHGLKKKTQGKQQSVAFADDEKLPFSIAEEGFLHNHDECIKSQKKPMDLHEFLKTIGLDEDACFQSVSACNNPPRTSKAENPMLIFEMEEISEPMIEDRPRGGLTSQICGSPNSPKMPYMMNMKDYDDFPSFVLTESPKRSK